MGLVSVLREFDDQLASVLLVTRPLDETHRLHLFHGPTDGRRVFCDRGRLQGMLDFEAALARAEAAVGLVPHSAVAAIETACHAERSDIRALAEAIATANLIADVLDAPRDEAVLARVREQVAALTKRFPVYG